MQQRTSELDDIKKEVSKFRTVANREIGKFLNEFTPDETSVLVRIMFEDTQYSPLIDLIPVWVRSYKTKKDADPQDAEDRRRFRIAYERVFMGKMRKTTGSDKMPDGRPKLPMWDAKNNGLLKKDIQEFGLENMKWFMLVFFSDKVAEISSFAHKAGYQYNVFHGMLGRLSTYDQLSIKFVYCPECGGVGSHDNNCPTILRVKKEIDKEKEEALRTKESTPDVDLVGMFKKKIRRGREKTDQAHAS